ncbi:MAG: FMN-binding protein [Spirochaetota bacterium]
MKTFGIFRERVFPILFMFIITVIFIAVVSSIYLATKDLVKLNESLFLKKAVLYAANLPIPARPLEIDEKYKERVREIKKEDGTIEYLEILDQSGSGTWGYAILVKGPGLWGEIEAVVAFGRDLSRLKGIEFIKQNETPGLGARISEQWFKEQFRGKTGPFKLVPEGSSTGPHEIDAITGASLTSGFVQKIVNQAVIQVKEIVKE